MTEEELAFLATIKENPRDWVARKVYSDWLEEHDRVEDADKQRSWNEERQDALEWIEEFVEEINDFAKGYYTYRDTDQEGDDIGEPYQHEEYVITVEHLLAVIKAKIAGEKRVVKWGPEEWQTYEAEGWCLPFDTPDFVSRKEEEFIRNASLVLGLEETEKTGWFFRCAC